MAAISTIHVSRALHDRDFVRFPGLAEKVSGETDREVNV
jgi:hypothetical protein